MATDWLAAYTRLLSGRGSDPSSDRLYAAPDATLDRDKGTAQALPLGDPADPISQIAMLLTGVLRGMPTAAAGSRTPSVADQMDALLTSYWRAMQSPEIGGDMTTSPRLVASGKPPRLWKPWWQYPPLEQARRVPSAPMQVRPEALARLNVPMSLWPPAASDEALGARLAQIKQYQDPQSQDLLRSLLDLYLQQRRGN